jgi:hypothetical protein
MMMKNFLRYVVASLLAVLGLVTLFLSSSVIFDFFGIREKEGNYVLFIVWANFISSILYLFSAYGLVRLRKWTLYLLVFALTILVIAFVGLLSYISSGGVYETKTIGAMTFRTLVTLGFTSYAYFILKKKKI